MHIIPAWQKISRYAKRLAQRSNKTKDTRYSPAKVASVTHRGAAVRAGVEVGVHHHDRVRGVAHDVPTAAPCILRNTPHSPVCHCGQLLCGRNLLLQFSNLFPDTEGFIGQLLEIFILPQLFLKLNSVKQIIKLCKVFTPAASGREKIRTNTTMKTILILLMVD